MIQKNFKQTPVARWVSASLAVATFSGAVYAATPLAGTAIKNYATVTYTDASGIQRSVQSNEAVVTVAPVYFATIESDLEKTAAPGNTVYLAHTLTNTGNTPDTYALTVTDNLKIYLDTNSDGQPSAGEQPVTSVAIAPGETKSLVVEYQVPVSATTSTPDKVIDLTATSSKSTGKITEPGMTVDASNDPRNDSGTVTSTIKISERAVIVSNKSMVFDNKGTDNPDDDTITYTLVAKNTGLETAKNVVIVDAIPRFKDKNGDMVTAAIVAGSIQVNGLLGDDELPTKTTFDESASGVNVNDNADAAESAVDVIQAIDKDLPPNTEISIQFSISLANAQANQDIENTYLVYEADPADIAAAPGPSASPKPKDDPDNPGNKVKPGPSNEVKVQVSSFYGVTVADTNNGDPDSNAGTSNDGGDDDTQKNAIQTVDSVGAGELVKFQFEVENTGNGDDLYTLEINNDDFPTGTIFTFWNADGTVQLTNIADSGSIDAGPIAQGDTRTLMVKAQLPPGENDSTTGNSSGYTANVNVTSHGDAAKTGSVQLELGSITQPSLDLALESTTADLGPGTADADPASANPDAGKTKEAKVGEQAIFDLQIVNEGTSPESYVLSAGADLPNGWQVQFADENGNLINSTGNVLPSENVKVKAIVTVSVNPDDAKGDSDRAGDLDTNGDSTPSNADKDYIFSVIAKAASNTSASSPSDTIKLAVDVLSSRELTITPSTAEQQTQAGGSVTYPYTVSNSGNEPEEMSIKVDSAWPANLMVDTDGDDQPDKNIANLVVGDNVSVVNKNPDGSVSTVTTTVSAVGADGPTITLQPGQKLLLENIVSSPSNAPNGANDTATITVKKNDNSVLTATGTTTIVPDQVRLTKSVALDVGCDGAGQKDAGSTFQAAQTTEVNPGDCVVWKIDAVNAGTTKITNVVITDNVPAFTTYHDSSLMKCTDSTCATVAPAAGATHSSGLVTFPITDGLEAGQSYTVSFTTKVDSDDPADQ